MSGWKTVRLLLWLLLAWPLLAWNAEPVLRGTGALGVIAERGSGRILIVDTSSNSIINRVDGLGDLSHASVVFSRDQRYAYVFGRDGGLSKVDILRGTLDKRIVQGGNSIGGAISQNGRLVAVANYEPGGLKVFAANTLEPVADIPAAYGEDGKLSKVVGIADLPGDRFIYSLFDADQIWIADVRDPKAPKVEKFSNIGKSPYDGLVTPDGRYYLAGLFGEDGIALLDTWQPQQGVRRILAGYGQGEQKLPVYKMPHLRGWAVAGRQVYLPAIGRHEVLVADTQTWKETAKIAVRGQPVFVVARPDGRQVWVNFAFPDNGFVQVIDTLAGQIVQTLEPGKAVLHLEFTPRGEAVWISARDDNKIVVYDTASFAKLAELPAESPSGIFLTARAHRIGF
ncbi:MAG: protein nirF [Candidatus Competibacteraceae bacterium]|nr:protein nirF [Candidatus Competibacteraceae bacterium]MBK8963303.1 protein nirF [Candidatus Competibacteraceae bacterium]